MKDVSEKSFSTSLSLMHSCMPRSIVLEETRKIMAWVFPWKLSRRKNCKRTTAKEVLQEELEAQNHQKPGLRGPGSRRAGISVLKTLPRTKVDSIKALKLLASPPSEAFVMTAEKPQKQRACQPFWRTVNFDALFQMKARTNFSHRITIKSRWHFWSLPMEFSSFW